LNIRKLPIQFKGSISLEYLIKMPIDKMLDEMVKLDKALCSYAKDIEKSMRK